MAEPTTRQEFRNYCLRTLGYPVIKINLSDEQIEDRIDDALRFFYDYHFEGSEKEYYKVALTATDIANRYITLPENIIGVVKIFPVGSTIGSTNMFSIQYQIALNDLYSFTSFSLVPYYMTLQHLQLIEEVINGQQPIRYNRNINRLYIDMDWTYVSEGHFLVVEAYKVVDPAVFPDVWKNWWLKAYATAKIKYQWGDILSKYKDMPLAGNIQFNGVGIRQDAKEQIEKLEKEMIDTFSIPISIMVG